MLDKKRHIPSRIYIAVSLISLIALLTCFLLSRGDTMSQWLFRDTRDTGMDFFHSIEYLRGRIPYEKFGTLYPPLANLFFYVIYRFIPLDVVEKWADTFEASISARGTDIDLRTYQAPMVMFILFVILCSLLLVMFCELLLKNRSEAKWVGFFAVLSIGVLYSFERGNIVLVSVILLLYFVLNYKSENKWIRETSLIALAISAGLKLYPAFFGVLLIRDKQWKASIRAIIYGVLTVIIPCFAFHEGLDAIKIWLRVTFSFADSGSSKWLGLGFTNFLYMISHILDVLFGITVPDGCFRAISYLVVAIFLLHSFFEKREWKAVFEIVFALTLFQDQGLYVLSMFLIPLFLFLRDEDNLKKSNVVWFCAMVLLTIPFPYPVLGITSRIGCQIILDISVVAYLIELLIMSILKFKTFYTKKALNS